MVTEAALRLADVRDRVARKVQSLPSAGRVYSNGSTDPDLAPYPAETVDADVHALVGRGASSISGGTGNQRLELGVYVVWRFPAIDRATADQLMDQLEDEMVAEFASDATLGGPPVIDCAYLGADEPFAYTDEAGREWIVLRMRVTVRLRYEYELTP